MIVATSKAQLILITLQNSFVKDLATRAPAAISPWPCSPHPSMYRFMRCYQIYSAWCQARIPEFGSVSWFLPLFPMPCRAIQNVACGHDLGLGVPKTPSTYYLDTKPCKNNILIPVHAEDRLLLCLYWMSAAAMWLASTLPYCPAYLPNTRSQNDTLTLF